MIGKEKNRGDSFVREDEQEPKESGRELDLISRADAMGAVQDHFNADGFKGYDDGQKMMDRITALLSAEAVSLEDHIKELNDLESAWKEKFIKAEKRTNEIFDETMAKVANECKECKERLRILRPLAEAVQEWIPVSERFPEEYGEYIVTVREKYSWDEEWDYKNDLAYYKGSYIGDWDTSIDWKEGQEVEITAWMPLPEPYKGGDAE